MAGLAGFQRKYLRGLAHAFRPVVIIGKSGVNEPLLESINQALNQHELIKIKFNDFKEEKDELLQQIEETTACQCVGRIGHIAILYRQHQDPEQRQIQVPQRESHSPSDGF